MSSSCTAAPSICILTNGFTTCWTPCTAPAPPESPSTVSATWQPHPEMNSASASTSTPLLQRCARANISVVMTQEVPDLFGVSRLSEYGISHLSDNVILLQFLRGDSRLKRALTISQSPRERP